MMFLPVEIDAGVQRSHDPDPREHRRAARRRDNRRPVQGINGQSFLNRGPLGIFGDPAAPITLYSLPELRWAATARDGIQRT